MVSSKDDKIFNVSLSIFGLEMRKGHLLWKVTELEKNSGVSRTLIYRYFGNSKDEIFESALKVFLETFYGFNHKNTSLSMADQVTAARELLIEHFEAVAFYQKWRNSSSKLRDIFIDVENRFKEKIKKAYPQKSETEQLAIYTIIHGLVTAPFLSAQDCKEVYLSLAKQKIL